MTYGRRRSDTRVLALCGGMVVVGGAERMTFAVLRALRDRNVAVHCVLNGWASDAIASLAESIGASHSASAYAVRLERRATNPMVYARQLLDMARTNQDLWRAFRMFRPTHILVTDHEAVLRNYPVLLGLRARGIRIVMKLCNAPVQTPFYRRLWRLVDAAISEFVCNSQFTQQELVALGVPAAKTSLIYETLPSRANQRDAGPREDRKIIFVGQIIPDKGLHVLLDAVSVLAARGHETTLDVVGDMDGWISPAYGDYRERLRERAGREDLAGRVRFLGWREDVLELMAESAVHCCPSLPEIRESFGLVVLEAKSCATPSVVFNSGALRELVTHGVDGIICARADAESLADGLEQLVIDPARRAAAGEAARVSAARFLPSAFARAWAERLMPAGRRPRAPLSHAITTPPAALAAHETYERPRHQRVSR